METLYKELVDRYNESVRKCNQFEAIFDEVGYEGRDITFEDVESMENHYKTVIEPKLNAYAVGVIRGTEENDFSDTTFVIGKHKDVMEYIKGKDRSEIFIEGKASHEEAKTEFTMKYGTYNNFDFKTAELIDGKIINE